MDLFREEVVDSTIMNIFFLSFNPRIAAEHHCDKHVVKMILETAQLLYSAFPIVPANGYKKTHVNHPCAIWTRESLDNYMWLCALGLALCDEYTFRYNKVHKTQSHLHWLVVNPPELPAIGITEIRQAMPIEYKRPNPIEAYRAYYIGAKTRLLTYSKRSAPDFLPKAI
jgi:hypothetical protein